ncbi:MAG TPA: hypothetical protein VK306_11855 [Acidimicrobiales bacterium]|nr:hypothetical protein [Acidimicrobiales bacterium]
MLALQLGGHDLFGIVVCAVDGGRLNGDAACVLGRLHETRHDRDVSRQVRTSTSGRTSKTGLHVEAERATGLIDPDVRS